MEIVHTIKDLQAGLSALRAQGKKVGLVPTMGALHAGHASLVKRCVSENDATVVSVFVNPTQFNDQNDLVKYPRTLEADCRLLEECGAAYVFAPSVEEMYPEPDTRQFSYEMCIRDRGYPCNGRCHLFPLHQSVPLQLSSGRR